MREVYILQRCVDTRTVSVRRINRTTTKLQILSQTKKLNRPGGSRRVLVTIQLGRHVAEENEVLVAREDKVLEYKV